MTFVSRAGEVLRTELALLVPAWLHGLDRVGDPRASAPCARCRLDSINALAGAGGLRFASGSVGDADVVTAICDGSHHCTLEQAA